MSGGNRLLYIALGLVAAAAAAIGWLTFPDSPTTQRFEYSNPRNADYHPGGSECQPSALAKIAVAKVRINKTEDCQKQAEEYRQSSDDLIQQTRAANAAQAQANVASQQLWTTWLQTLGGFLTLAAAVGAAIYARDAANHTRESNVITKATQRAWVTLKCEAKLTDSYKRGLYLRVNIVAENVGDTAANYFALRGKVFSKKGDESWLEIIDRMGEQAGKWRKAHKAPKARMLAPRDSDIVQVWEDMQPPELHIYNVDTIRAADILVLGTAFYRTNDSPDTLQVGWRVWHICKFERDHTLSFIPIDERLGAELLRAEPMHSGMVALEYPIEPDDTANDDTRHHKGD